MLFLYCYSIHLLMDVLNFAVHLSKLCAKFGWNCVTGDTYAILSFFPTSELSVLCYRGYLRDFEFLSSLFVLWYRGYLRDFEFLSSIWVRVFTGGYDGLGSYFAALFFRQPLGFLTGLLPLFALWPPPVSALVVRISPTPTPSLSVKKKSNKPTNKSHIK